MNSDENGSEIVEAEEETIDFGLSEPGLKPKKKKLRILLIVLAAVVAIVGAAGIGLLAWHEDPGFCNAICHTPMDPYVEGFYSGDQTLLVTKHAENGEMCLSCHEPTIGQQIDELGVWLTKAFSDPLKPTEIGTEDFCLRCHDFEEVTASTDNYGGSKRNPHIPHSSDGLECYTCHSMHRESFLFCNYCHRDVPAPIGWAKP